MWIYRGDTGRAAVRQWCRNSLDTWRLPHRRRWVRDEAPYEYRGAHLVVAGPPDGPTVVVLPGRHGCAAVLTDLLERLAADHRVVAVDLPGEAGLGSGGRPNTDRLRDYGSWFDGLLAELARDAPDGMTVLAHGSGAAVALAARPAPHVRGLVLLNPYGLARPALRRRLLAAVLGWRLLPGRPATRRLLTRLGGPGFSPTGELVDWLRTVGRHVAMSSTPSPCPDLARRWRGTPCTVAVGEHDPLFGDGRLVHPAHRALHAGVVVVPGAGSLLPYERPDAVLDLLRRHHDRGGRVRTASWARGQPAAPGASGSGGSTGGHCTSDRSPGTRSGSAPVAR